MKKIESLMFSIIAIISLIFSLVIVKISLDMAILMMFLALLIFLLAVFVAFSYGQDWQKNKRKMVLGLPIPLFIFYSLLLIVIGRLFFYDLQISFDQFEMENAYLLTANFFFGWLAGLISWFTYMKKRLA